MENKINCSKLIESIRVNRKDEPKQSRDEGVGCNLDNEILPEDEELIRNFQLTEEQIRLKNTNAQEFWKSLAETARCDLNDHLDDNKEVILYHIQDVFLIGF